MASLAELIVQVGADISSFSRHMQEVQRTITETGRHMMNIGNSLGNVGNKMAGAITVPVLALGASAVVIGAKFDKQMSRVQAISGATGDEFTKLRDKALELGQSTSFSASEVAQGMEEMASAGFSTQEIMDGLGGVLDLASASGMGLADATSIVGATMNGFGMEASESTRIADVFAKAQAVSASTTEGLGEAMKYVAPVASAMGLSLEETTAAIGILNDAGIQGGQAGTVLRQGLLRLTSPTKEMKDLMSATGSEFFDANGKMKNMAGIVDTLKSATAKMTDEQKAHYLATLFGTESVSGFMALLDAGSDTLKENTKELENSEGSARKMAETMKNNLAGAWEELTGALETLAIKISDLFKGDLQKLVGFLKELVEKFTNLSPSIQKAVVFFALFASAIGPLLIVIGLIANGVGALMVVFGALSAPVMAIIGAVALFVAGLVIAYAKIEPFREIVNRVFSQAKDLIVQALTVIVAFVKEKLDMLKKFWDENGQSILEAIQNVWGFIAPIIDVALQLALAVVKFVWNAIKQVIDGALNIIMGLVQVFAGIFTGDFSKVWEGIKKIFKGAIDLILGLMSLSFVKGILNLVKGLATKAINYVKGLWDDIYIRFLYGKDKVVAVMNSVKSFLQSVWNGIKTTIVNLATQLWNGVRNVFNTLKSGISSIWNSVKSLASSVWNSIKSTVVNLATSLWNSVRNTFNSMRSGISTVWNGIKSLASSVWNGIKSTITSAVNGIKSTATSVFNGLRSTVTSVFNGIKSTATRVWNGIKTAITSPIESAQKKVLGIIGAITGAFASMKISIPRPKLPSISVGSKSFLDGKVKVPTFKINWNAKGAIFNSASVLGGGQGVGEAGAEAVIPIQHKRYMAPFARAVADHLPQGQTRDAVMVENVIHTTIELDGEVVGRKTEKYISRQQNDKTKRKTRRKK